MDRKYKQRGYQDTGRAAPREKRPPREDLGGPRQLAMPGRRTVLRCADCGVVLPAGADTNGQCPRCRFELHSCKQCAWFDSGSRFECAKPIPGRIARKDARNECAYYEPRVTVERDTSSGARPADARAAFDSLFKR